MGGCRGVPFRAFGRGRFSLRMWRVHFASIFALYFCIIVIGILEFYHVHALLPDFARFLKEKEILSIDVKTPTSGWNHPRRRHNNLPNEERIAWEENHSRHAFQSGRRYAVRESPSCTTPRTIWRCLPWLTISSSCDGISQKMNREARTMKEKQKPHIWKVSEWWIGRRAPRHHLDLGDYNHHHKCHPHLRHQSLHPSHCNTEP